MPSSCEGTVHNESGIKWCPASEFIALESFSYSFATPEFDCNYEFATDGQAYEKVVAEVENRLEEHIAHANLLISNNEKVAKLSETIEETLRVAIGRTQLLLRKRMKQFKDQLERHLNPVEGQKLTKLDDLHGLWALIEMSLQDIRACFDIVEKSRLNGWDQELSPP